MTVEMTSATGGERDSFNVWPNYEMVPDEKVIAGLWRGMPRAVMLTRIKTCLFPPMTTEFELTCAVPPEPKTTCRGCPKIKSIG